MAAHPGTSAHAALHKALYHRQIERGTNCEQCGGTYPEAHHDDYSKPLDVRWLCRSCHQKHHAQLRADQAKPSKRIKKARAV